MFPLNKNNIIINNTENSFLKDYSVISEIPILPHPGAFSKKRKNHIHEGVDLYCESNDSVFSMEDGEIINILPFTGEHINSPWWNNTWCILIKHKNFILNYGEIKPSDNIFIGKKIKEGELIGNVIPVLLKNKGRPMSMLHLEMYSLEVTEPIKEWGLFSEQPKKLLNPTNLLLSYLSINNV